MARYAAALAPTSQPEQVGEVALAPQLGPDPAGRRRP